jgi:hypothetical protein
MAIWLKDGGLLKTNSIEAKLTLKSKFFATASRALH